MPGTADLASILKPPTGATLQFGQAKVISWNSSNMTENVVEWSGSRLTGVGVMADVNALTIEPGHVVGMLGWSPEGGVSTWWVIGRIISPEIGTNELLMRGGGITLAGGDFRMTSKDGATGLLFFGGPDRTWSFSFGNGELAFFLSVSGNSWAMRDVAGHEVVSTDDASGTGLARPYVPLRMVPSSEAQISGTSFYPSHTSTSFTRLMYGFNPIFHPRVEIGVATATAGGGSAEWRLLINGTDVTGTQSGGGTQTVQIPGWGSTVLPGHTAEFTLQARIAGGGTRVFVQCDKFFALQS